MRGVAKADEPNAIAVPAASVTPMPALTVIPDMPDDEDDDVEDRTGLCAVCDEALSEDDDQVHAACAAVELRAYGMPVPEVAGLLNVADRTVQRWTNSKAAGA